jgi:hypothetical protein
VESERETVAPAVCWKFSAAFSTVGSGRKRGPTLLETHNENSAPTTTAARKIESLGKINCVIGLMEILPETVSKGPKGLTNLDVRTVDNSASEFFCSLSLPSITLHRCGKSRNFQRAVLLSFGVCKPKMVGCVSDARAPVLITGESGCRALYSSLSKKSLLNS